MRCLPIKRDGNAFEAVCSDPTLHVERAVWNNEHITFHHLCKRGLEGGREKKAAKKKVERKRYLNSIPQQSAQARHRDIPVAVGFACLYLNQLIARDEAHTDDKLLFWIFLFVDERNLR